MKNINRVEYCNERLIRGFVEDIGEGERASLVITGLEEIGGDAAELVSCIMGLYNEAKSKVEWDSDFKLKLVSEKRSATL